MVMYMSFKINKFNSDVDMFRTYESLSFSLHKKGSLNSYIAVQMLLHLGCSCNICGGLSGYIYVCFHHDSIKRSNNAQFH